MKVLKHNEAQLFKQIASMTQPVLLKTLGTFLEKRYKHVVRTDKYLIAEGDIPIALVAHLDTVFSDPPENIFYDERSGVMWSPEGLGADDRAGVYSILKIVRMGYKPHIIFTTDEEVGGKGASELIKKYPTQPFADLRYLIELDRQGHDDCVFYSCENPGFTEYVESFGFVEEWGTFSDISVICPQWGIAGVNLSIGYINEHSYREMLYVGSLINTVNKVCNMLDAAEYLEEPYVYIHSDQGKYDYLWKDFLSDDVLKCDHCGKEFFEFELVPVKLKSGKTGFYCPDCIASNDISWCATCYEAYEIDEFNDNWECADCRKM